MLLYLRNVSVLAVKIRVLLSPDHPIFTSLHLYCISTIEHFIDVLWPNSRCHPTLSLRSCSVVVTLLAYPSAAQFTLTVFAAPTQFHICFSSHLARVVSAILLTLP